MGKLPVVVLARELDPVVIPLARGAAVTTVQGRDFRFAVDLAEYPRAIIVTARPARGLANRAGGGAGSRPLDFGSRGVGYDRGQQHLELYDADGRRLDHVLGSQQRGADQLGFYDRYRLMIGSPARGVPGGEGAGGANRKPPVATELRYYEFSQNEVEIPFDFRDIPLP